MPQNLKNVVVLGGSYGGATAANRLAQTLPKDYRVVLIERNTHANHLYAFPRMSVLPGHEHKAFIPYTHIFDPIPLIAGTSGSSSSANSESSRAASPEPDTEPEPCRHLYLHAHVVGLGENVVKLDRAFPEYGFDTPEVPFEYAVYALGSRLPAPIDLWAGVDGDVVGEVVGGVVGEEEESPEESSGSREEAGDVDEEKEALKKEAEEAGKETPRVYTGSKAEAVEWMRRCQERIKGVSSVLVAGGGALGIQFATDIASLYPDKKVTLLHSRNRLLPRYAPEMHSEIMKAMSDLGVTVILDERLDLSTVADSQKKGAERVVKTLKGREIAAELVMLCTGQVPNTAPLRTLDESIVRPDSGLACVLRTMQVASCGQEGDYLLEPVLETEPEVEVEVEQDEDEVDETEVEVEEVAEAVNQTSLEDTKVEEESTPVEPPAPISKSQPRSPHPNIFVVGDAADAFGAIKAGHVAFYQAQVAVANINKMIAARVSGEGESEGVEEVELERYEPSAPAIKVSLGLTRPAVYEIHGQIGFKEGADDLDAGSMWPYFGFYNPSPEDLYL